jgi:hypothetical protein
MLLNVGPPDVHYIIIRYRINVIAPSRYYRLSGSARRAADCGGVRSAFHSSHRIPLRRVKNVCAYRFVRGKKKRQRGLLRGRGTVFRSAIVHRTAAVVLSSTERDPTRFYVAIVGSPVTVRNTHSHLFP